MVGGHTTVGWQSNNVFRRFKRFGKIVKIVTESHAKVVGGHETVGWLSNNVFRRFKGFGKFLKKVTEGHATVVGGHATVDWLSNNVFLTFQAIRIIFEKSRWTVTRQWSEVTRLVDDCQTTFFRRFKQFGKILKKSHWRSRDSGRRSRDRWMTVKQCFLDVSSDSENFWKKSLKVTRQWSEVTQPLYDCRTTFFLTFQAIRKNFEEVTEDHATVVGGHATVGWLSNNVFRRFKRFGKILKNVTEGHATVVGGHATVVWLSNNVFFLFQAIRIFLKINHWRSRDSGRRSRDRWMTVNQCFFDVSGDSEKFWKKSLKVTREWSEVTRPLYDCQTTFFSTFQAIRKKFEKSRWTATRQRSEVTRPLDDCQTTFFWWFKPFEKNLKKVTEVHATVVGGHATVGWLTNNVF